MRRKRELDEVLPCAAFKFEAWLAVGGGGRTARLLLRGQADDHQGDGDGGGRLAEGVELGPLELRRMCQKDTAEIPARMTQATCSRS